MINGKWSAGKLLMYNLSFTGLGKTRTAPSTGMLGTAVVEATTGRTEYPKLRKAVVQVGLLPPESREYA